MSGSGLVKVKQFEKLPPHFELIYKEVADVFRMWAKEQNLNPIVREMEERGAITADEWGASTSFGCNRSNRKFQDDDRFDISSIPMFSDLILRLHKMGRSLSINIAVRHASLAEPAVLLAEMLEQHLKSWLPKDVSFPDEILVEYRF